jgi:general secretion pathway protein K
MKAFGGPDGAEDLGGLLGIDASSIKGLGVGKGGSFDVTMATEDGKINLNCGGGLNAGGGAPPPPPQPGQPPMMASRAQALYQMLTALIFSPRYNRLFDNPDADGQYATRDLVARAIIDWSDIDESGYDPTGASGSSEDYRYDALRDPYKAHNNYFDTVEEVGLVKGVGDDFWGSFGEMFTVYGRCLVNLNAVRAENWPITAAVIRAAAKDPQNPVLLDDVMLSALSQQIGQMAQLVGGLQNTQAFIDAAKNGGVLPMPQMPGLNGSPTPSSRSNTSSLVPPIPGVQPIELDASRLGFIATVGPRQVYRIDSVGSMKRAGEKKIDVHIRAVFDTVHYNQNTTSADPNDRMGTWVYWRME